MTPTLTELKNHPLPLARIKKIMKSDEDVRMISSEAPVLFAKACELFILELTHRAWAFSEANKRRTLQHNDITAAILNHEHEILEFLVRLPATPALAAIGSIHVLQERNPRWRAAFCLHHCISTYAFLSTESNALFQPVQVIEGCDPIP
jgi:histone H3/H4